MADVTVHRFFSIRIALLVTLFQESFSDFSEIVLSKMCFATGKRIFLFCGRPAPTEVNEDGRGNRRRKDYILLNERTDHC